MTNEAVVKSTYCKINIRNLLPVGGVLNLKMLLSSIKLNAKDLIWYSNSKRYF